MRRGGLTCRNWLRLECASGNWDDAVEAAGPSRGAAVAVCRPVVHNPGVQTDDAQGGEKNTKCGAHAAQSDRAVETEKRVRMTQDLYYSKMNYAKTTRKIELLMGSLSKGTQAGYRRSWRHWMAFCRGQAQTVWIDSREEWWGETLMNFILIEHDVLGLRASTIRGEVGGIRFFHIISGQQ